MPCPMEMASAGNAAVAGPGAGFRGRLAAMAPAPAGSVGLVAVGSTWGHRAAGVAAVGSAGGDPAGTALAVTAGAVGPVDIPRSGCPLGSVDRAVGIADSSVDGGTVARVGGVDRSAADSRMAGPAGAVLADLDIALPAAGRPEVAPVAPVGPGRPGPHPGAARDRYGDLLDGFRSVSWLSRPRLGSLCDSPQAG